jgi:hypothetical protein
VVSRMATNPKTKTAALLTIPNTGMTTAQLDRLQASATNAFTAADTNIRPAQRACGLFAASIDDLDLKQRRLDRAERDAAPLRDARPAFWIGGDQSSRLLGDVNDNRAGLCDDKPFVVDDGHLTERANAAAIIGPCLAVNVVGPVDPVGQPGFLQRPKSTKLARFAYHGIPDALEAVHVIISHLRCRLKNTPSLCWVKVTVTANRVRS